MISHSAVMQLHTTLLNVYKKIVKAQSVLEKNL
jgi:hypothetical protein